MNGFLNVLKPPGMSSAAVVGFARRMTDGEKAGHAGTLDPEAAGVLPIMIGKAARLFDYLVEKEKEYVAEVAFGTATDTQDATGTVTATGTDYPDRARVLAALPKLIGDIDQRPSMYSAIKRDGKPLYALARQGETVEVPTRLVHVANIELMDETPQHGFMLRVTCGRGTYIRSICNDLGELVGCPAHMRFLLRSRTGVFDVENAMTLEEVKAFADAGELGRHLIALDTPIAHMKRVDVPEALDKPCRNGVRLPLDRLTGDTVLAEGDVTRRYLRGQFWGIGARENDELCWRALIAPENEI